jgi:cysteine desulfurase
LDYAAATPTDPKVIKAMAPFWGKSFGNPSSLYKQGREAKAAVELARKKIADVVGARPKEIIFTAGGTESCNLAILGMARMDTDFKTDGHGLPHIIISAIEHHAVLNPARVLEGEGYTLTILPVDKNGFVDVKTLQKSIRPQTILVSVMYANNEIGTIEPIGEISKFLKSENQKRRAKNQSQIIFHTDACQAAGFLDLNVNRLGVDLMSVNGSKIYGPKQTGFLFVRDGINLKPIIYGGGQEKDLRSGTENVAGIVGLAKALEIVDEKKKLGNWEIGKLQEYFISKLMNISGIKLNGPECSVPIYRRSSKPLNVQTTVRLPNNINITIKGIEGEALMLYLDGYGVSVSTGSACSTGSSEASHVLLAIGRSKKDARSAIRFSLGKHTTKDDLDYVLKILPGIVAEMRKVKSDR